jgi:hypothetical protein
MVLLGVVLCGAGRVPDGWIDGTKTRWTIDRLTDVVRRTDRHSF